MRYSKQRELVLRTVEQLCDHPTAEEIFDKAAPECPGLSLGTVYRNLNSLVEAGMVRRVSIPGRADRFDHTLCWHSHLYCTACGGVVDADVDEKQVMRLVRRQKDVVVQDCAVVLFGLCEACAKKDGFYWNTLTLNTTKRLRSWCVRLTTPRRWPLYTAMAVSRTSTMASASRACWWISATACAISPRMQTSSSSTPAPCVSTPSSACSAMWVH